MIDHSKYEAMARETFHKATGFPVEAVRPEVIGEIARVLERTALEARIEEAPDHLCFHCGIGKHSHFHDSFPPLQCPRPGSDDRHWESRKEHWTKLLKELTEGTDANRPKV